MERKQIIAALLAVCLTAGCKAQSTSAAADASQTNRRIEVMVRSQYNVPQDYNVSIGDRKPSQLPGYDTLPVTLSKAEKKTVVEFLISSDGNTLARLEKFDLLKDPLFNIDVTGRPIRGNPAAKVTVIDFDDLECPYCSRLHATFFPATAERYKDKIRFIYKDNPLPPEMHPWAVHAAVDANCLASQSGTVYWAYVDYLHGHGQEITGPDNNLPKSFEALDRVARQEATVARLDSVKLDACIVKQDESEVRGSLRQAEALKIEGAPAVFVNGERIDGAVPEEQVWAVIDRALRSAGVDPPPNPAAPASAPAHPAAGSGN